MSWVTDWPRRVAHSISGWWRGLLTPRSVQEVVDAGPMQAADQLPLPHEDLPREQRELDKMDQRLNEIEQRNRELARLFQRRREGG